MGIAAKRMHLTFRSSSPPQLQVEIRVAHANAGIDSNPGDTTGGKTSECPSEQKHTSGAEALWSGRREWNQQPASVSQGVEPRGQRVRCAGVHEDGVGALRLERNVVSVPYLHVVVVDQVLPRLMG